MKEIRVKTESVLLAIAIGFCLMIEIVFVMHMLHIYQDNINQFLPDINIIKPDFFQENKFYFFLFATINCTNEDLAIVGCNCW